MSNLVQFDFSSSPEWRNFYFHLLRALGWFIANLCRKRARNMLVFVVLDNESNGIIAPNHHETSRRQRMSEKNKKNRTKIKRKGKNVKQQAQTKSLNLRKLRYSSWTRATSGAHQLKPETLTFCLLVFCHIWQYEYNELGQRHFSHRLYFWIVCSRCSRVHACLAWELQFSRSLWFMHFRESSFTLFISLQWNNIERACFKFRSLAKIVGFLRSRWISHLHLNWFIAIVFITDCTTFKLFFCTFRLLTAYNNVFLYQMKVLACFWELARQSPDNWS